MNYGNTLGCRCVADNTQICLEHKVIKVHFADGGYDARLSGMTTNCVLLRIRLPNDASEDVLLGLGRRTLALRKRRPKRRLTAFRSQLAAFLVALSLVVQLFAAATPPAMAAPAFAGADDAAIAAELKALFGDTAQLCVQVNDDKAPAKHAPSSHCCDQCPLCRFAAQTVAFVSPELPALPERLPSDGHATRAPPGQHVLPAYPVQPNPARAPPLAV
jgi:hypothetical protein